MGGRLDGRLFGVRLINPNAGASNLLVINNSANRRDERSRKIRVIPPHSFASLEIMIFRKRNYPFYTAFLASIQYS